MPASAKRTSSLGIRPVAPLTRCAAPHAAIVAIVKTKMLVSWTYQVPRLRSHSGTCWISGITRHERRRQQQDRRDQEDAGRVVALVARRPHDEELRQRDARREDRELEPVAGRLIELREERGRDGDRDRADDEEVRERLRRQLAAGLAARALALDRVFERDGAHRPLVPFMPLSP